MKLVLTCLLLVGCVILGCCLLHQLELLLTLHILLQSDALLCTQGVEILLFKVIQFLGRLWLYTLLLDNLLRKCNLALALDETLHMAFDKLVLYNVDDSWPFGFVLDQ